MEFVTLNNGVKMPILGYGVYQVGADECERCALDENESLFFSHYDPRLLKCSQNFTEMFGKISRSF